MSSGKVFGGKSLKDLAAKGHSSVAAPAVESAPSSDGHIEMASSRLAQRGAPAALAQREPFLMVDPKRCRAWKYHNRAPEWFTAERCSDLIDSIPKQGQMMAALARKIDGDPNYDYEIIFGMRRRFSCEFLGKQLKIILKSVSDAEAATLMRSENQDRKNISAMEDALSLFTLDKEGVFTNRDAMAVAMSVSKGQLSKMLKAAEVMQHPTIAKLFPTKSIVPLEPVYKVAVLFDRAGAKDIILRSASNMARDPSQLTVSKILANLLDSPNQTKRYQPLARNYSLGSGDSLAVKRNDKGKITLKLTSSGQPEREAFLETLGKAYDEFFK